MHQVLLWQSKVRYGAFEHAPVRNFWPLRVWHQSNLYSVWKLGAYTENSSEGITETESAEQNLRIRAEFIKQQVIKSAGVLNTYFMSMFEVFDKPQHVGLFRHGQYPNCNVQGSFGKKKTFALKATPESAVKVLKDSSDDFFSPCRPSDYLEYRVQPMLRFYQG